MNRMMQAFHSTKNGNLCSYENLYPNVGNSFICNGEKIGTTQESPKQVNG